jgi:membrane protease YdiL (CAAX protease family)
MPPASDTGKNKHARYRPVRKTGGIGGSLQLLSLLPRKMRGKILTYLSPVEKSTLQKSAQSEGGWKAIRSTVSGQAMRDIVYSLRQTLERREPDYVFEFIYLLFLVLYIAYVAVIRDDVAWFLSYMAEVWLFLLGLPILVHAMKRVYGFSFKAQFTYSRLRHVPLHLFEGFLVGLPLYFLVFSINQLEGPAQLPARRDFLYILPDLVAVPLFEEILNRYFIMKRLLKRAGPFISLIVSSALFAVFHLPVNSIISLALYFLCGILLGGLFHIENYLLPCVLAHGFCNLLVNLAR